MLIKSNLKVESCLPSFICASSTETVIRIGKFLLERSLRLLWCPNPHCYLIKHRLTSLEDVFLTCFFLDVDR